MKNNTTIVKTTSNTLNNTVILAQVRLQQVISSISDMDNDTTIALYNDMADSNGYDRIYDNDEYTLNELFMTPYDAIRQTNNKDYNDNDNYFTFNGYGHAISFDYRLQDNSPIDIEELAQWIADNDLYNEYDIEVTTLDDMYNCILDYVNDIDSVSSIQSLLSYLAVDFLYTNEWLEISEHNTIDNYIEKYINLIIAQFINSDDIDQLEGLLDYFKQ